MQHVLSLGAGVQSSTMALMAAVGEIEPMPQFAVFADTQAEPQSVYDWLDWLEKQLPFPVHRVTAGSLTESATRKKTTADGRAFSTTAIPCFTLNHDGSRGMIPHRSCTRDFKIRPLMKAYRNLCRVKRGTKQAVVTSWIGISLDEVQRMRDSREAWITNRYPLIERRISRRGCMDWMESKGYPMPPRSACVYCPFHSSAEWRRLQVEEPEEFQKAVEFEKDLQAIKESSSNFNSKPYLHRSLKPLDQIDFRSDIERGQGMLWDDECEGMCGV